MITAVATLMIALSTSAFAADTPEPDTTGYYTCGDGTVATTQTGCSDYKGGFLPR